MFERTGASGIERRAPIAENILERGPVLVQLSQLLHRAGEGEGQLAFVAGEAGIGKTTLVRHFGQMVQRTTRVLMGTCDPLSTPSPLAPLYDLAEPLRLNDLLSGGYQTPADIFGAVLNRLRGPRAAVIVFEDVHWADAATLDLLRFIGRRIETTTALVIATFRDDEIDARHPLRLVLGDLATAAGVNRFSLQPLSLRAVTTLVGDRAIDPADLYRRTGGNPFFVTEVLAAGGSALSETIPDAVLARVARLAPGSRVALEVASVAAPDAEDWLLEAAGGFTAEDLDGCVAAGMLRSEGGRFNFRHELAREVVYESILPRRRADLHRVILAALAAPDRTQTDYSRLAHHAEAAGEVEAVLDHAREAAIQAASLGSHREAAAQYARALRYSASLPPAEKAGLLEAYAAECSTIDHNVAAIAARQDAHALYGAMGDRIGEGRNLASLAGPLVGNGRNAEAEDASRAALEMLEQLPPSHELGRAYVIQAGLRMLNRDNEEAVAWGEKALELATRFADTETIVAAHNRIGSALLLMEDERGRVHLERSRDMARAAGLHAAAGRAWTNLGSASGELFDFSRAVPYLEEGIHYCREYEIDFERFYMTSWLAVCYGYQGRYSDAERLALEVLSRPGTAAVSRITALAALARVQVRRGDTDASTTLDDALAAALPTGTLQRLAPIRLVRAESAWLAGDLDRTRSEVHEVLDLAIRHRHPWFTGELLVWLQRAGESVELPDFVARPHALTLAGQWHEAAESWRQRGCPYEAALVLSDSGGTEDLREGVASLQALGARPAAQLFTSRLRQQGIQGIPRGPRPSTRQHPARLTPRQDEVLRLLVEGLQNVEIAARLFISCKTVDNHVAALFRKLEVDNRLAAVHEAQRRGLLDAR